MEIQCKFIFYVVCICWKPFASRMYLCSVLQADLNAVIISTVGWCGTDPWLLQVSEGGRDAVASCSG